MTEDQLSELSKISSHEFLTFLVQNKAQDQIAEALKKWLSDQLPRVAREQIVAEDITLVSFVRKQVFLTFLPQYTSDPAMIIAITREIDVFIMRSETASTNAFIQLLKDRINEEAHFNERITHTLPGIVYVHDLVKQQDIYLHAKVNTEAGYTEDELQTMGTMLFVRLTHPDDRKAADKHHNDLLSTKDAAIRSFEFRLKAKNGGYRWHRSYESVFRRAENAQVWQIIGFAFDIQEEKDIAEKLKYREDQLLEAQRLAGMGSFEWDISSRGAVVTPQVFNILQLKRSDNFDAFISNVHPHDKKRVQLAVEKAISEQGIYDCEYRYIANNTEKVLWSRGTISYKDNEPVMKGTIMDVTDRYHMIQRLQSSEELYKQAQAATHIGNYTLDLTTNKLHWSDELYRIYEIELHKEITREELALYNHPDDVQLVSQHIARSLETGKPFDFYYRIIVNSNKIKILHAKGELLRNETGQVYRMFGTAQDVTERQQLIERLQQSEELYKQAQALTHIGNWSWDIIKNELSWSEELYNIFEMDLRKEKISLEKFIGCIHPEDKDNILLNIKKPHDLYYRIIVGNEKIKFVHGKGEVLLDENDVPCKMIGTSQDVTEEKLVERQLLENQNFIQKIADATPSIITSYNIHTGKYSFVNQGLKKLLGYEPQQVLTEGIAFIANLVHPEDIAGITEKNSRALEAANSGDMLVSNDIIAEFQYRMLHKNGKYRWFHTYGTVFDRNANGLVENVLNISLDVTERMEVEQVLFEKNLELQQSNASLEEFAYVASHDLQEPLRKISTFGDRLLTTQHESLDDEGRLYLQKIITSAIRMQKMINDVLSLSMISGNKSFQTYSLQKILNEVLIALEHKIEEKKAVIHAGNLPIADVIPSQFRQLFQNLITNSLKFARRDIEPQINISSNYLHHREVKQYNLAKANRYLQIVFTDNGIGFNSIFAEKIFVIFQRLHGKSEYEGTGIGLSICKKIIENHGGVIYASGKENSGASFQMIIPA